MLLDHARAQRHGERAASTPIVWSEYPTTVPSAASAGWRADWPGRPGPGRRDAVQQDHARIGAAPGTAQRAERRRGRRQRRSCRSRGGRAFWSAAIRCSRATKSLSPDATLKAGTNGSSTATLPRSNGRRQEQDAGALGRAREAQMRLGRERERRSVASRAVSVGPTSRSGTIVWNLTACAPASAARWMSRSARSTSPSWLFADLGDHEHLAVEIDGTDPHAAFSG